MGLGAMTMNMETGGRPSAPVYHLDVSFPGDSAYPTGGTPNFSALVTAAARAATPPLNVSLAASDIVGVDLFDGGGYAIGYDKANDKLKVYWCAAAGSPMSEVTAATNLSTTTFRVTVRFQ